ERLEGLVVRLRLTQDHENGHELSGDLLGVVARNDDVQVAIAQARGGSRRQQGERTLGRNGRPDARDELLSGAGTAPGHTETGEGKRSERAEGAAREAAAIQARAHTVSMRWSAKRSASAMMVSVGLALPPVVKTDEAAM